MSPKRPVMPEKSENSWVFWGLVVIQSLCAVVFLWDVISSIFGLRETPLSWQVRELLEVAASIGLILGAIFGVRAVALARSRAARAEAALKSASGAFVEVVEAEFENWQFTDAERDVAWFSLKGISVSQIAELRGTSVGTVKAQTNAIYRKAGVSGRAQLLSVFVEDLLVAHSDTDASGSR